MCKLACKVSVIIAKYNQNLYIIQKLLVFERKIFRGIFGPMKENQTWRIKNNEELDKLIKHENIVNYIKAQ